MIRSLRDSATWRSLIGYCSSLLFIALHCFAIYSRASALSGQSDEGSFPQAVFIIIILLLSPLLLGAPVAYADIYDLCPDILPLSYLGGSLVR